MLVLDGLVRRCLVIVVWLTLVTSWRLDPSTIFFHASYGSEHTRQKLLLGRSATSSCHVLIDLGGCWTQAIILLR